MNFALYLYKKFLPVFLTSVFFFCLVLILVDILMNIWNYTSQGVPLSKILEVEVLYIPKALSFSLPLSLLFAVTYVLSDLYAKNELTAIFASGVSLFAFTLPLIIFSIVLTVSFFVFEDRVVVSTYSKKVELEHILLNQDTSLNNSQIVILTDGGKVVYKATYYDDAEKKLFDLFVVNRNDDASLNNIIVSEKAVWNGSYWECDKAFEYTYEKGNLSLTPLSTDSEKLLTEPPDSFQNNEISVETVSTTEAKAYIARLQRSGLPTSGPLAEYYKKFSFPFIILIVVLLSVGLSGKTRKNVLLISLVLSICAAVLFYVVQMVTMLLAQFGYIPPVIGAWFPVIMFVFLSIILLKYAKT